MYSHMDINTCLFSFIEGGNPGEKVNSTEKLEPTDQQGGGYKPSEGGKKHDGSKGRSDYDTNKESCDENKTNAVGSDRSKPEKEDSESDCEEWLRTPMEGTGNYPMNGLVVSYLHPKYKDGDVVAGSQ